MQCDPNLARADWGGEIAPALPDPQPAGTGCIFIQPSVSYCGHIELAHTGYMNWVKLSTDEAAQSGADNRPVLTIKGHGVCATFPRVYLVNGSKSLEARIGDEVGGLAEMDLEVAGCNTVAFGCALDLMVCGRALVPDQDFPAFLTAYKDLDMSLVIPEQVMESFLHYFNQGYVARVVATDWDGLNRRVEVIRPRTYPAGHHECFNGSFPAPMAPSTIPMNPPQQAGNYMTNGHYPVQQGQAGYYGGAGAYNGTSFPAPIAGPPTANYSMDLASVSAQLPQIQSNYSGGHQYYPDQAAGFPTNADAPQQYYQGWGNGYNPPPPGFNHQQVETAARPSEVDSGLNQLQLQGAPAAGAQAALVGNMETTNFSQTMNENGFSDISDASYQECENTDVDTSSSSFENSPSPTPDYEQATDEGNVFLQAMDPVLLTPSRFGISGSEIIHQKATNNMGKEQSAGKAVNRSVDAGLGQQDTAQLETTIQDDGGMPPEVIQEHQSGLAPVASSAVAQHESDGVAPVASSDVTQRESGVAPVPSSADAQRKSGVAPVPSSVVAQRKSGVAPVASAAVVQRKSGVAPVASAAVVQRKSGVAPVASAAVVQRKSGVAPVASTAVTETEEAQPDVVASEAMSTHSSASPVPSTASAAGARSSASLAVPSTSSAVGARSSASPVPSTSTAAGVHVESGRPSNDQPDGAVGQGSGSAKARRSRTSAKNANLPHRFPPSILKNRDMKKIEKWVWSGYINDDTASDGVRLVYFCDHCPEVFHVLFEARMHAYEVAMHAITFRCCWCDAHFGKNKEACVRHMMEDHAVKYVPESERPQLPPGANGDDDLEPGEIRLPVRPTPPPSSDVA